MREFRKYPTSIQRSIVWKNRPIDVYNSGAHHRNPKVRRHDTFTTPYNLEFEAHFFNICFVSCVFMHTIFSTLYEYFFDDTHGACPTPHHIAPFFAAFPKRARSLRDALSIYTFNINMFVFIHGGEVCALLCIHGGFFLRGFDGVYGSVSVMIICRISGE